MTLVMFIAPSIVFRSQVSGTEAKLCWKRVASQRVSTTQLFIAIDRLEYLSIWYAVSMLAHVRPQSEGYILCRLPRLIDCFHYNDLVQVFSVL